MHFMLPPRLSVSICIIHAGCNFDGRRIWWDQAQAGDRTAVVCKELLVSPGPAVRAAAQPSISVQHSYYLEVLGPTCFCCCGKWEPWDSAWVNCKCRAHTSDPRQRAQSLWCICHPSNPSMATPSVCKGLGLSIATARVAVPVVRRRWKLISSRQSEQLRITCYALIWSFAGGPPWLWMLQIHRHLPL